MSFLKRLSKDNAFYLSFGITLITILVLLVFVLKNKSMFNRVPQLLKYSRCIALPVRKEHASHVLTNAGVPFQLVDPVLKDELDLHKLRSVGFLSKTSKLNRGRIACHLSHLKVIEEFLATDEEYCTIFEDDIMTSFTQRELYYIVNSLYSDLRKNNIRFDIIYLSKCWEKCEGTKKLGLFLYDAASPVCRHAYVVSRKGAKIILDNTSFMDKLPGDEMYRRLIHNKVLRAYSCVPQLFYQNRQKTGIMSSNLDNNGLLPECSTSHKKASLIVMNYKRPEILKYIIEHMINYDVIDDIIILNNNPDTRMTFRHPRVRTIDSWVDHEKYGVANRFVYGEKAKNNQILYIDDDILVSSSYIRKLLQESKGDPNNIYGYFRRICNERDGYISNVAKEQNRYDTIITGTMLTSKQIVQSFVDYMHVGNDFATDKKRTRTIWNGEDLFINLVVRNIYKKNPVYVAPNHTDDVVYIRKKGENSKSDKVAISNQPGHFEYREQFCRIISKELEKSYQ